MSSSTNPPTSSTTSWPDSSTESDSSEATEAPTSSSTSSSEPVSLDTTTTDNESLSGIRYEDRIFVVGDTGSGKSELAKQLFLATPLMTPSGKRARRIIIDPADSSLTATAADITFNDPKRVPDCATARFVPKDPDDKEAYNTLYRWVFDRFPAYVWLDEANIAAPVNGYPKWANTYVVQGRKRGLGHLACDTRPRGVCKNFIAQAQHVFIFALATTDDRKYLAENIGVSFSQLEELMQALPEYGFIHYDRRSKTLFVCDPLDL